MKRRQAGAVVALLTLSLTGCAVETTAVGQNTPMSDVVVPGATLAQGYLQ